MKHLLALLALLGAATPCIAAEAITGSVPYTGSSTAMSATGYAWSSGRLYALPSATLDPPTVPFTVSYNVKTNVGSIPSDVQSAWIDSRNNQSLPGILVGSFVSGSFAPPFNLTHYLPLASGTACQSPGENCARPSLVNDGGWHNVCWNVTAGGSQLYIDSLLVDNNPQPISGYIPQHQVWIVGPGAGTGNFRDIRVYNTGIGSLGCQQLGLFAAAGKTPTSGYLQNNLASHWPMNNCDAVGCADTGGNGNNLIFDTVAPTCSVTAPAPAFSNLSGNQTFSATCSDPVGIKNVAFSIDGAQFAVDSTSPYSVTWNTANYIDGSHVIGVTATNISGTQSALTTITGTTLNSIAAKTIYLDPTSGVDCPPNRGTDPGFPCSTLTGVQSVVNALGLHGGDSILQKAGTNLNIADMTLASVLTLAGPLCTSNCNVQQNSYPGQNITFGTYGGSGNCHVLAGTTTDCASITMSANGTTLRNNSIINMFNLPNTIVQNFRMFGSQANAYSCPTSGSTGCNSGIRAATANNYINGTATNTSAFTNNEITDFWSGLYVAGNPDPGFTSIGSICNFTISDNYSHGLTISSQMLQGIFMQNINCAYPTQATGPGAPVGVSYTSNFVTNQGGSQTIGLQYFNSLLCSDGCVNIVDNYNVATNAGYWSHFCGGGYPNWWYQATAIAIKGNEVGNVFPRVHGACDTGGFDFDNGTSLAVLEFNYSHETWGPSLGVFSSPVGTFPQGPFTIAYDIFENGGAYDNQAQTAMVYIGSSSLAAGPTQAYNNSIWNGYNGHLNPVDGTFTTNMGGFGINLCPPAGMANYFLNNIVVADSGGFVGAPGGRAAQVANGGLESSGRNCQNITYKNNDYWPLANGVGFKNVLTATNFYTVATWNTASGDTGTQVNPNTASPGGGASTQCYAALSGVPVQPGTLPCPGYQLQTGNALIGAGLDLTQAPYSSLLNVPLLTTDFFTNAIPHGTGTGYNVGPDGAHH